MLNGGVEMDLTVNGWEGWRASGAVRDAAGASYRSIPASGGALKVDRK